PQVEVALILPADFPSRRLEARIKLATKPKNEQELLSAVNETKASIASVEIPASLLAHRTLIAKLHTDLGGYRKAAQDRPALVARQNRAEDEARGILRDLNRPEDLSQSESLRLSRTQRAQIQSLGNEC